MKNFQLLTAFFVFSLFSISAYSQVLFWSQPGTVLKSKDLVTGEEKLLFETDIFDDGNNQINDIALDTINQRIFFNLHVNNPQPQQDLLMSVDYTGANLTQVKDFPTPDMEYHHGENKLYYLKNTGSTTQVGIRCLNLTTMEDELIYNNPIPLQDSYYGLHLDEDDSKIYFMKGGFAFQRMRINLDGTGLEELTFLPSVGSGLTPNELTINAVSNDYYLSASAFSTGSSVILRVDESGAQVDTVFMEESTFFNSVQVGTPFVDTENEKIYFYTLNNNSFSSEVTRVFKRSDFDGTNLEILNTAIYPNASNSDLIEAWAIDPSVGSSLLEVSVTHYTSGGRELNYSPPNQTVPFKVCADGSEGSIFGVNFSDESIDIANIILRVAEDPNGNDTDKYGSFTNLSPITDDMSVLYQHPQYVGDIDFQYVNINVEVVDLSTNEVLRSFPLNVYRAPVLMVHGIWSNSGAFDVMKMDLINSNLHEPYLLLAVNYPNAEEFNFNGNVVKKGIEKLTNEVLSEHIAVEKVDIVSHSMGGILSRLYIQSEQYSNNVHKLITINTPHSGSHLATLLADEDLPYLIKVGICYEKGCDGAEIDLQLGSPAIVALNQNKHKHRNIPSHAIYSTLLPTELDLGIEDEKIMFDLIVWSNIDFNDFNQIFDDNHDIIVSEGSQIGGINDVAITPFTHYHVGIQADQFALAQVKNLLNSDIYSGFFSMNGFNPPSNLTYNSPFDQSNNSASLNINFNNPTDGETVNYGETVNIDIQGNSEITDHRVCFGAESFFRCEVAENLTGNTSNFNHIFTPKSLGEYSITVLGMNEDKSDGGYETIKITVNTDEIPTSISPKDATYDLVTVGKGDTIEVFFNAQFSNFNVDISKVEDLEFIFSSNKASRVEKNIIKGEELGEDTLIVKFNGVESEPIKIRVFQSSSDTITSTNEISFLDKRIPLKIFKIFPNPSRDNFAIDFHSPKNQNMKIQVTDLNGKKVFSTIFLATVGENLAQINLPMSVPKGIYFVTVQGEAAIQTAKFIKQ